MSYRVGDKVLVRAVFVKRDDWLFDLPYEFRVVGGTNPMRVWFSQDTNVRLANGNWISDLRDLKAGEQVEVKMAICDVDKTSLWPYSLQEVAHRKDHLGEVEVTLEQISEPIELFEEDKRWAVSMTQTADGPRYTLVTNRVILSRHYTEEEMWAEVGRGKFSPQVKDDNRYKVGQAVHVSGVGIDNAQLFVQAMSYDFRGDNGWSYTLMDDNGDSYGTHFEADIKEWKE